MIMPPRPTNLIELVWVFMREHERTWISKRVALELLDWRQLKDLGKHIPPDQVGYPAEQLLRWFTAKGLLVQANLPVPAGGASERRTSQVGRWNPPHYFVADQTVWDALSAAARIAPIDLSTFTPGFNL